MRIAILTVAAALAVTAARADRPFELEEPEPLPEDRMSIAIGAQFRDEPKDFALPDRDRQWNAPRFRLAVGLGGRTEIRIEGDAWRRSRIAGNAFEDAGDWTVSSKIRFWTSASSATSIGGVVAVKLPNAGNEKGLGTDETDTFLGLMLRRDVGGGRFLIQGRLGILGDPRVAAAQNDVAQVTLGWHRPLRRGTIGLEYDWQAGPAADDDPAKARVAWVGSPGDRWRPFVALEVGLTKESDEAAIEAGIRRTYDLRALLEARRARRRDS